MNSQRNRAIERLRIFPQPQRVELNFVDDAFYAVCADGGLERVKTLFPHVKNINIYNSGPLRFAIANEHFDIADFLLKNGGVISSETIFSMTLSKESLNYCFERNLIPPGPGLETNDTVMAPPTRLILKNGSSHCEVGIYDNYITCNGNIIVKENGDTFSIYCTQYLSLPKSYTLPGFLNNRLKEIQIRGSITVSINFVPADDFYIFAEGASEVKTSKEMIRINKLHITTRGKAKVSLSVACSHVICEACGSSQIEGLTALNKLNIIASDNASVTTRYGKDCKPVEKVTNNAKVNLLLMSI